MTAEGLPLPDDLTRGFSKMPTAAHEVSPVVSNATQGHIKGK
jgi:hypothetical protein